MLLRTVVQPAVPLPENPIDLPAVCDCKWAAVLKPLRFNVMFKLRVSKGLAVDSIHCTWDPEAFIR